MLEGWSDFYLMIGSSAAALIGLFFVVVTLTSGVDRKQAQRGARIYMSPSVFHFAVVLVISAATLAPGASINSTSWLVESVAAIGFVYASSVALQFRKPGAGAHWTDFWFYGAAPVAIYLALGLVLVITRHPGPSTPDLLASALVVLLVLGIRNAWDLVTWLAPTAKDAQSIAQAIADQPPPAPPKG